MNKNYIIYGLPLIGLLLYLAGCIEEFTPKDIDQMGGLLVVEGTITGADTRVKLSRSVGLLDDFSGDEYIDNATVWVESSDGTLFEGIHQEKGEYRIAVPSLDKQYTYRLRIHINGSEYASEFLEPLYTPEVDSIFFRKREKGSPVRVCVATHDPLEQSDFYRWSYKENWEVRADLVATIGWVPVQREDGTYEYDYVEYSLNNANNIYACWGVDSSNMILLGTSEKLSGYRIGQAELFEIPATDDRLSNLYHIAITQTMVRKEAYDYFNNLKKNVESGGTIFSPMPSELRGNIYNINDPSEEVIGYIEVSTTTKKERFLESIEGFFEYGGNWCGPSDALRPKEGENTFLYYMDGNRVKYYAPHECFDCRRKRKATKDKPSWWPTDWPS